MKDDGTTGSYHSRSDALTEMTSRGEPVDWEFVFDALTGSEPRLRLTAIAVCTLKPNLIPTEMVGAITVRLLQIVAISSDEVASSAVRALKPFKSLERDSELRKLLSSAGTETAYQTNYVLAMWGDGDAFQTILEIAINEDHFGALADFWYARNHLDISQVDRIRLKIQLERFLHRELARLATAASRDVASLTALVEGLAASLDEPL